MYVYVSATDLDLLLQSVGILTVSGRSLTPASNTSLYVTSQVLQIHVSAAIVRLCYQQVLYKNV